MVPSTSTSGWVNVLYTLIGGKSSTGGGTGGGSGDGSDTFSTGLGGGPSVNGGSASITAGTMAAGGGGGGYGAAGGYGKSNQTNGVGGAGGKAINTNGNAITWIGSFPASHVYGAVN